MIHEVTVEELKEMRAHEEPLILLDVRRDDEWEIAHLHDATLIPLHELPSEISRFAKDAGSRKVIVYCHHGNRSKVGAALLRKAGAQAFSLKGGIDAWSERIDHSLPRY